MVVKEGFNALVVLGPTATGKTALGVQLARVFSGEVISADSRQVYRGLDIGSGKDIGEYGDVPYHLIDIADLEGEYSVFDFQRDFRQAFADVSSRGALPVVVGGTGMYLDSVIREYEFHEVPENAELRASLADATLEELAARLIEQKGSLHNRTDLVDRARLLRALEIAEFRKERRDESAKSETKTGFKPLVLGVRFPREETRERIRARLDARLAEGLIDEVSRLHGSGASWERLERLGLEYRITAEYLQGKILSLGEYTEELFASICRFAKRQETWFRGMERKGVAIEWVERGSRDEAIAIASRHFGRKA